MKNELLEHTLLQAVSSKAIDDDEIPECYIIPSGFYSRF